MSSIKTDASKQDFTKVMDQYKDMQQHAYKNAGVTSPELSSLKEKVVDFIEKHVTDSSQRQELLSSTKQNFQVMEEAVHKAEAHQGSSDQQWDDTRAQMDSMMQSLAPEGASAAYSPTQLSESPSTSNKYAAGAGSGTSTVSASTAADVQSYVQQNPAAAPYVQMAEQAGKSFTPPVPTLILLKQLNAESSFNPSAVGQRGEKGMSQFTTDTWKAYGNGGDPFNPQDAIMAQARYMSELTKQNGGSTEKALMAYNGWEFDKPFDYNVGKGCSPTYVQDITGNSFNQRNVS